MDVKLELHTLLIGIKMVKPTLQNSLQVLKNLNT